MANQFSIQPANPNYGLQGLLSGMERGQQRDVAAQEKEMQQQKLAQQQQIMGLMVSALRHARTLAPEDASLADDLIVALTRAHREREAAAVLEGRTLSNPKARKSLSKWLS